MPEIEFCPCRLFRDEINPKFLSADGRCTAFHAKPKRDEHGDVIFDARGKKTYDVCDDPLGAHPIREKGNKVIIFFLRLNNSLT
jgi:hypothetical protein